MEFDPERIVIKYGGNAMRDETLTTKIVAQIAALKQAGYQVVIVHGGGPFIEKTLKMAGVESRFVAGQRQTTAQAMPYIEMALKGQVNGLLVRLLNQKGLKAVGLSGKDGKMVQVKKHFHTAENGEKADIGFVGQISTVETTLLEMLLQKDFVPVVCPVSSGQNDGLDYNVNADMFAGEIAGALKAHHFVMLTDVDGLMRNPADNNSLLAKIQTAELQGLMGKTIKGGMIPKTQACQIAIEKGAKSAVITNGTKPELLKKAITNPAATRCTIFTA